MNKHDSNKNHIINLQGKQKNHTGELRNVNKYVDKLFTKEQ